MRLSLLALIIGMLSLRWLPWLPSTLWLLPGITLALLLLHRRIFPIGFFLLGLCWACFSAQLALDDQLAHDLDGRTLWVEGAVVGLPEWPMVQGQPPTVRFELKNTSSRRAQLPKRIRLSWRAPPEQVKAGER